MADSNVMAETVVPAVEEISTMKVTDLRKKLKAFGLPITGNKVELVERLQEACYPSKGQDSSESFSMIFDDSQIKDLDDGGDDDGSAALEDENALLEQDQYSSYISSSLEEDESKVLDSPENKTSAVSVIMPPKKRSLIKIGDGSFAEKKLSLNRTNVTSMDFHINVSSETKPEVITATATPSDSEVRKVSTVNSMSAAERLAMRAKRFNTSDNTTSATVKVSNSKSTNNRNSKQSIISSATAPDLNVLKKRAERFGQNVSTVMKQIEEKEKLLKRKCKFGASLGISATSSINEPEKKRQRAARFGIS